MGKEGRKKRRENRRGGEEEGEGGKGNRPCESGGVRGRPVEIEKFLYHAWQKSICKGHLEPRARGGTKAQTDTGRTAISVMDKKKKTKKRWAQTLSVEQSVGRGGEDMGKPTGE